MEDAHIQIDYGATPEKLYSQAEELVDFLVEKLRQLNAIEEKYAPLYNRAYHSMKTLREQLQMVNTVQRMHEQNPGQQRKEDAERLEQQRKQLEEKLENGIRVNGVRFRDEGAVWNEYQQQYGEVAKGFCSPKLLEKGYAQSMHQNAKETGGEYSFLNRSCALTVTMKTPRRAVVEMQGEDPGFPGMPNWLRFTLTQSEGWCLEKVQRQWGEKKRWRSVGI